jgi:hypothetical protein
MRNVLATAVIIAALIVAGAAWAYGGRECETRRVSGTTGPGIFNPGGSGETERDLRRRQRRVRQSARQ